MIREVKCNTETRSAFLVLAILTVTLVLIVIRFLTVITSLVCSSIEGIRSTKNENEILMVYIVRGPREEWTREGRHLVRSVKSREREAELKNCVGLRHSLHISVTPV